MSISHALHSWNDLYRTLHEVAATSRGVVSRTSLCAEPASWPRTTGFDALTLASVFDMAIRRHGSPSLVARWCIETDRLGRETSDTLGHTYSGNRLLWATLSVAASTLHQLGAALPPAEVCDAAFRELATGPGPTCPAPAAHAAIAEFPGVPAWDEMAQLQLRFFWVLRGADVVDGPLLGRIPRTTNADVLQLATYWTEQMARIGCQVEDVLSVRIRERWEAALTEVAYLTRGASPHSLFGGNVEFWRSLLALAIHIGETATAAPWTFYLDALHHSAQAPADPRNAGPLPMESETRVEFPAAKTWDEAAQMQKAYFVTLRGEDIVPGGLAVHVPRTTNGDVAQLAAYWSMHLARVGVHHPADKSYRHVVDRWKAAVADVDRLTRGADPKALYPRNADFWGALVTIAIQVAVTEEAPTRWTLIKESVAQGVRSVPDTLTDAAAWVAGKATEGPERIVTGIGRSLAKPLLVAVSGLIGLVLLLRAARGDRSRS